MVCFRRLEPQYEGPKVSEKADCFENASISRIPSLQNFIEYLVFDYLLLWDVDGQAFGLNLDVS